jgi:hypothetical protein
MLDKVMSSSVVAKMCGTSTQMIYKFYNANMALETMLNPFNKVSRRVLKVVK